MNLKSRQEMPLKQFIDLTTTMILLFGPLASMYIALSILWIALGLGIIELNEPITPKVFLYAIPIIIVIQIVFSAWCCSIVGGKKWLKDKLELKKKDRGYYLNKVVIYNLCHSFQHNDTDNICSFHHSPRRSKHS